MMYRELQEKAYILQERQKLKNTTKIRNDILLDINNNFVNLSDENKQIIINTIKKSFKNLRYSRFEDNELNKKIEENLFPEINFEGISKVYSEDMYLQTAFLKIVNDELHFAIVRENNKNSNKIL